MEIEIISKTPDFLKIIYTAARVCKSAKTPIEIWEEDTPQDKMLDIADKIIRSKHLSILEHCTVTYAVSGVSRVLLSQYTRHRIGVSLSVQSQRSVDAKYFNFVTPESVASNSVAGLYYEPLMKEIKQIYQNVINHGIPKEDARFILPLATTCNFVTTLNLRSLMDIYEKRVKTPGAQWEIKSMVQGMASLLIKEEPWLQKYFVSVKEG